MPTLLCIPTNNPADDITRGMTLKELSQPHHWHHGHDVLCHAEDRWLTSPSSYPETENSELKKFSFCEHVAIDTCPQFPDISQFSTWQDLIQATTKQSLHGVADQSLDLSREVADYIKTENLFLRQVQSESFP